jgi:hypothetical protein
VKARDHYGDEALKVYPVGDKIRSYAVVVLGRQYLGAAR